MKHTFYVQLLFKKIMLFARCGKILWRWKSHRWQCGACAYDHFCM